MIKRSHFERFFCEMLFPNHTKTRNLNDITSKFSNFREILTVFANFNDFLIELITKV